MAVSFNTSTNLYPNDRTDKQMYEMLLANMDKWNASTKAGGANAGQRQLPVYKEGMDVGQIWQDNLSAWEEEQRLAEEARQRAAFAAQGDGSNNNDNDEEWLALGLTPPRRENGYTNYVDYYNSKQTKPDSPVPPVISSPSTREFAGQSPANDIETTMGYNNSIVNLVDTAAKTAVGAGGLYGATKAIINKFGSEPVYGASGKINPTLFSKWINDPAMKWNPELVVKDGKAIMTVPRDLKRARDTGVVFGPERPELDINLGPQKLVPGATPAQNLFPPAKPTGVPYPEGGTGSFYGPTTSQGTLDGGPRDVFTTPRPIRNIQPTIQETITGLLPEGTGRYPVAHSGATDYIPLDRRKFVNPINSAELSAGNREYQQALLKGQYRLPEMNTAGMPTRAIESASRAAQHIVPVEETQ